MVYGLARALVVVLTTRTWGEGWTVEVMRVECGRARISLPSRPGIQSRLAAFKASRISFTGMSFWLAFTYTNRGTTFSSLQ